MLKQNSPLPNFTLENSVDTLTITISKNKSWLWFIALGFDLLLWVPVTTLGTLILEALAIMLLPDEIQAALQFAVWPIFFALLIGQAFLKARNVIWHFADNETIEVNSQAIKLQRQAFGLSHSRIYRLEIFGGLQVLSSASNPT